MDVRHSLRSNQGLTLLETLIASFLLLFILLSMISAYAFGRLSLDREEVKRKATALAQDRLETVRARYARERLTDSQGAWDRIIKANIDTTYVVDRTTFTLVSTMRDSVLAGESFGLKTVSVDVNWTAKRNNNTSVARSVRASTWIAKTFGAPS